MEPLFIGEIRTFPYNRIPEGWAECNGQLLSTTEYPALFSLINIQFGGNGEDYFALPDLRGRAIVGCSSSITDLAAVGIKGGTETVTLTSTQMPSHSHSVNVAIRTATNKLSEPNGYLLANMTSFKQGIDFYGYNKDINNTTTLNTNSISDTGKGESHNNMMPYMPLTYCIAISGLYPSRY